MNFEQASQEFARWPFYLVEIEVEACTLDFGTGSCQATGVPCYNTQATCKDRKNIQLQKKKLRFCEADSTISFNPEWGVIPLLSKVADFSPTQIRPNFDLGGRGAIAIEFFDTPLVGKELDPYSQHVQRGATRGNFFAKLLARQRSLKNNHLWLVRGFQGVENIEDLERSLYVISKIEHFAGGMRIHAKDFLSNLAGKVPKKTNGRLAIGLGKGSWSNSQPANFADLTPTTSLTLKKTNLADNVGAQYGEAGYVRVEEQIFSFKRRRDNVLEQVRFHGPGILQQEILEVDAEVQLCYHADQKSLYEILTDYLRQAGITNIANLETDEKKWLDDFTYTVMITEPTDAKKLIDELLEQNPISLWFNEKTQKIQLKPHMPALVNQPPHEFDQQNNIDHLKISQLYQNQVDILAIYYDLKSDILEPDEPENFNRLWVKSNNFNGNLLSTDSVETQNSKVRRVFSRYLHAKDERIVSYLADWLWIRFETGEVKLEWTADISNYSQVKTGSWASVRQSILQDVRGQDQILKVYITESAVKNLSQVHYKAYLVGQLTNLYAFIAPDDTPEYANATAEQKRKYAFIALEDGVMPDGSTGYALAPSLGRMDVENPSHYVSRDDEDFAEKTPITEDLIKSILNNLLAILNKASGVPRSVSLQEINNFKMLPESSIIASDSSPSNFVELTETDFAPGKPITSGLLKKLYNNLLAGFINGQSVTFSSQVESSESTDCDALKSDLSKIKVNQVGCYIEPKNHWFRHPKIITTGRLKLIYNNMVAVLKEVEGAPSLSLPKALKQAYAVPGLHVLDVSQWKTALVRMAGAGGSGTSLTIISSYIQHALILGTVGGNTFIQHDNKTLLNIVGGGVSQNYPLNFAVHYRRYWNYWRGAKTIEWPTVPNYSFLHGGSPTLDPNFDQQLISNLRQSGQVSLGKNWRNKLLHYQIARKGRSLKTLIGAGGGAWLIFFELDLTGIDSLKINVGVGGSVRHEGQTGMSGYVELLKLN